MSIDERRSAKARFDPVTLEILWRRLISIVDEADAAVARTAFSSLLRDAHDYTCMFTDSRGRGRVTAELVARGLFERGYDVVDLRQMETVFGALKLDYSAGLSLESLSEVRRRTRAEALIFGTVDRRWTEVSLMMIDTELGEAVLTAKLRPRRRGPFPGPEALAEEVAVLVSAKPKRDALDGIGPSELAPPQ